MLDNKSCEARTYRVPPWRNWLARSAVNRKVGGSSPPGGEAFFVIPDNNCELVFIIIIIPSIAFCCKCAAQRKSKADLLMIDFVPQRL